MKAILIARVSTEEQKEAGNPLPAQKSVALSSVAATDALLYCAPAVLMKALIFLASSYSQNNFSK